MLVQGYNQPKKKIIIKLEMVHLYLYTLDFKQYKNYDVSKKKINIHRRDNTKIYISKKTDNHIVVMR